MIQNGPRIATLASDPRDTTRVACVRALAGEGAVLLLQHLLKAPLLPCPAAGRVRLAASPRLLLLCRRCHCRCRPSPVLVPLVPLSVLVLLGSWVLQVRDIGKVILFRKP